MGALLLATFFLLPILLGANVVEPALFGLLRNPFRLPKLDLLNPFRPAAVEDPQLGQNEGPKAVKRPNFQTQYAGAWKIVRENGGVSAMHLVIMKNDKAMMFDSTAFAPSPIALPQGNCRVDPFSPTKALDCWACAVEFDIDTAEVRPLKVRSFLFYMAKLCLKIFWSVGWVLLSLNLRTELSGLFADSFSIKIYKINFLIKIFLMRTLQYQSL